MSDAYDAGQARSLHDARRVLDLDGHTAMMQVLPDRMPDHVPMEYGGRASWLLGYSHGIHAALARNERK